MKQKILNFLKSQQIMTVATLSVDNRPQGAVVLYVADDDFNLYFPTSSDSRKASNIMKNNAVSATIWEYDNMSLQIEGEAELITDKKTMDPILDKLAQAGAGISDHFFAPLIQIEENGNYIVVKIKPNRIQYIDLTDRHIKELGAPLKILEF